MKPLNAHSAVQAWEKGHGLKPLGQAVTLLGTALPAIPRQELLKLPLGQRDALLFRLRELTFGSELKGSARCPRCNAPLEFVLDLHSFDVPGTLERRVSPQRLVAEGYEVLFRLPNSLDLAAMARCQEVDEARRVLIERCVLGVRADEPPEDASELPDSVIQAMGERMEELDPMAELPLAIDCQRCGHDWMILLEMGVLLWREISRLAQRLLRDVHVLALAYGWSEAEILGMSAARRKFYLSQVPQTE